MLVENANRKIENARFTYAGNKKYLWFITCFVVCPATLEIS